MAKHPPRDSYNVGNRELSPEDRAVIRLWSGQPVPKSGAVMLVLTVDQRVSLTTLFMVLGVRRRD